MNVPVSNLRTLVLNADMQPVSWAPLSVWGWQEALVAVIQERVIQVRTYDDVQVRSGSRAFDVPAVVALKRYRRRKKVSFTRYHLFLRDEFRCQYCGERFPAKDLTFDHVIPRSKGGLSEWRNIVACCSSHNLRKGNKTPSQAGLKLMRRPFEPTPYQIDAAAKAMAAHKEELHQTWLDYLYWDSELWQL